MEAMSKRAPVNLLANAEPSDPTKKNSLDHVTISHVADALSCSPIPNKNNHSHKIVHPNAGVAGRVP